MSVREHELDSARPAVSMQWLQTRHNESVAALRHQLLADAARLRTLIPRLPLHAADIADARVRRVWIDSMATLSLLGEIDPEAAFAPWEAFSDLYARPIPMTERFRAHLRRARSNRQRSAVISLREAALVKGR